MAGKVQALEIVAGRPQSLKKIKAVIIAGDELRDLGSCVPRSAAVRRKNSDPGRARGMTCTA